MDNRKILILYASAGHGHEKAARALEEASAGKAQVQCLDVLTFLPLAVGVGYRKIYLFLIDRLPWLWGLFYYLLDINFVYGLVRPFRRAANWLTSARLERFLVRENPDCILCTHFMPVEVASHLRKKGRLGSKIIAVITDFLPHAFWLSEETDCFVVAASSTKEDLARRGVPERKIQVLGIPIEAKFSKRLGQEAARRALGLEVKPFTVLVTSGGAGVGALEKIVNNLLALRTSVQVIVVCGNNQSLFAQFSVLAAQRPWLKVLGFVSNMHELMEAADAVVGKAGGLTVSESLAMERPMILFKPVPGQEGRNAACLAGAHAGFIARSLGEIGSKVLEWAERPEALALVRRNAKALAHPHAAQNVLAWVGHG